ncbi:phospholipid phosphatase 1 isoform X6 [Narcine bancroftii]|uniref:phospholipid phosphatase 1 isoform X6 n=1 Tax=Narcine bancroftii TaxID=1343680 RepID=UPI0038311658
MFDRHRVPFVCLDVFCVLLASQFRSRSIDSRHLAEYQKKQMEAGLPFAILSSIRSPFRRGFYCNDETLKYPYKEDTISYQLLAGTLIPVVLLVIIIGELASVHWNILYSNSFIRNSYIATVYKAVGTFLFGAAASQSLTDIAKYSIGRLRPHFIDVCQPDWTKINCTHGYINDFTCLGDKQMANEARLSFFSGHSSFSMYCMMFLAIPRIVLESRSDIAFALATSKADWRSIIGITGNFIYRHEWWAIGPDCCAQHFSLA